MGIWDDVLAKPAPQGHFVQLYSDLRPLTRNVGRYLAEGLRRGDPQLVIASREHNEAFCSEIEAFAIDPHVALESGGLLLLDSQRTLAEFMVHGQPDWLRFKNTIEEAIDRLRPTGDGVTLGAYGEMVGELWAAGEYSAAITLERFWNELLCAVGFNLFCAYPIDVFGEEFQMNGVDAILCDHTHMLPTGDDRELENAIDLALGEILGTESDGVRRTMASNYRPSWGVVPKAEGTILWIRKNLPGEAGEVLRLAGLHYHASQSAVCA
jgi:hypothetical protein